MSIGLRYGIAMSAAFVRAYLIRCDDRGICVRMFVLEPTQQGRSEIEADVRVVVHNSFPACRRISYADAGIWLVTLGINTLVPVVKRCGAGLDFNNTGPGILAGRLVEMAVNNKGGHGLIRTQATKRHKRYKSFKR